MMDVEPGQETAVVGPRENGLLVQYPKQALLLILKVQGRASSLKQHVTHRL